VHEPAITGAAAATATAAAHGPACSLAPMGSSSPTMPIALSVFYPAKGCYLFRDCWDVPGRQCSPYIMHPATSCTQQTPVTTSQHTRCSQSGALWQMQRGSCMLPLRRHCRGEVLLLGVWGGLAAAAAAAPWQAPMEV
jgi:hypothetical protein